MQHECVVEVATLPDILFGQHRRPDPVASLRLEWTSPKEIHAVRDRWTLAAIKTCTNDAAALRIIPIIAMRLHASAGYAFPSNESVAADAACSVSAVKRGMAILIARGCVQVERERGGKNGGDRRKVFPAMPVGGSACEPPAGVGGSTGEPSGGSTGEPAGGPACEPAGGSHAVPINSYRETLIGNVESEAGADALSIEKEILGDVFKEMLAREMIRLRRDESYLTDEDVKSAVIYSVARMFAPGESYSDLNVGRCRLDRHPRRDGLVGLALRTHGESVRRVVDRLCGGRPR